jgi:hypothetical protein
MAKNGVKSNIPNEVILTKILLIRGKKVMIDRDLAELYGVSTKRLNEQVKRNIKRFPADFMYQLTKQEKDDLVAICDHLKSLKFSPQLPYVFTEHGAVMLASILNSDRAKCLKQLLNPPEDPEEPRPRIGFRRKDESN